MYIFSRFIINIYFLFKHEMYNRFNNSQKESLQLKSHLNGIKTMIFRKRHYDNMFSGKLVNKLHDWIEKHPHVILSPNVSDQLFFKINSTLVIKQKHLLQILA